MCATRRQPQSPTWRFPSRTALPAIGGDALTQSPALVKPGGALVSKRSPTPEVTWLVDQGKVRPQVVAVYPLAETCEAYMAKATQHIPGKVVLTP